MNSGKAVDLVLRNAQEIIFVEVAVSHPLLKEISNLTKDCAADNPPDRMIFLVPDNRSRLALARLMSEKGGSVDRSIPVEVRLITELIERS